MVAMKETGTVAETMPNNLYKVKLDKDADNENLVTCYLAGKMRLHKIRVIVGDQVKVLLDPYGGKATNRIIERL